MKNILQVQQLICLMLFVATMACKKTNTVTIRQPGACFEQRIMDPIGNYLVSTNVNYIDSNFYFRSCSYDIDGTNTTYRWHFGDGTTSTGKEVTHKYAVRGKYMVTLEVTNKDIATDTVQKMVSVISGQTHITFGEGKNVYPVAISEQASGDFQLLGYNDNSTGYFLMQLDSLYKQKGMKTLPAGYRLASMKPTSDGNFIFTGTTSGLARNNELVKLKPDGTLIWSKVSAAVDDTYTSAAPTADGGYIVLGTYPVMDISTSFNYARVKKYDANGNMQWDRSLYAEGMIQAKELVVEQDGVVLAGVKRSVACSGCDSVLIAKLDNGGNVIWKNTAFGGLNTSLLSGMRTIKHTNGNYIVSVNNTKAFFVFSSTGTFLDRKINNNTINSIINSGDGNLIVLNTNSYNFDGAAVSKINMAGSEQWFTRPDGNQKTATGSICCANSYAVSIQSLQHGGSLTLAQRVYYAANNSTYYVIMLLPLDEAGKQQ